MRTLISTAFVSLDGVVEDPGGQSDYRNCGWTFKSVDFVPEAYAIKGSEQMESTAILLGAGQRLFGDSDKDTQKLKLVDSEVFSNGIQKNVFDVIH